VLSLLPSAVNWFAAVDALIEQFEKHGKVPWEWEEQPVFDQQHANAAADFRRLASDHRIYGSLTPQ
jgi:hypothetical protein